jgi:2-haloacid dehalogenase
MSTASKAAAPKVVVWDIGNVLLDWSPDYLYRRLIPDDAARADFFARLPFDAMNLAGDRDGDLEVKVAALANKYPEDAMLILPWWAAWDRMVGGMIEGSFTLRDDLRARGVPCWALSNFAADSWDRAEALYPQLAEFEGLIISGRERMVKPDDAFFALAERRIGATGADIFFIDDRAANIDAAKERGWRGHMFETPKGLAKALAEVGL